MELEEAINYLKNIVIDCKDKEDNYGGIYSDFLIKSIETVLQALEDTEKENSNLKSYLHKQGLISDYIKFVRRENK